MADEKKTKSGTHGAKHTLCRRIGYCLWGMSNCPTAGDNGRTYPAGQHGPTKRRGKLSTYGELLIEKQKLKAFYQLSEHQLLFYYRNAKHGEGGNVGDKLVTNLEMRLCSAVYRSGLAPTIFAARQIVSHRHVLVNGKVVDRASYRVKAGDVLTINAEHSPMIAKFAQDSTAAIPAYMEKDANDKCKVTVVREPLPEEIHLNISIIKVVEYYNLH